MGSNLRRLWFVVPSHYESVFSDGFPNCSLATDSEGQGRNAIDGDLSNPMTTDGGLTVPFYLYLDGIGSYDTIYFEGGNWTQSNIDTLWVQAGVGYGTFAALSEAVGNVILTTPITSVQSDDEGFLVTLSSEVTDPLSRIGFFSTTSMAAAFTIPNVWVGKGYQMDAMFSLGASTNLSFIQKPFEKSASGVPITQSRTGASFGSVVKRWSMSFEWIDSAQLQDLKDIYSTTQGFRPFKMIMKNDGSASTEPNAYSVAFSEQLKITEVENGYYTVTVDLIEHI